MQTLQRKMSTMYDHFQHAAIDMLYAAQKITEVELSAFKFVYRLFHEDFSSITGTSEKKAREIFKKQSVNKCR